MLDQKRGGEQVDGGRGRWRTRIRTVVGLRSARRVDGRYCDGRENKDDIRSRRLILGRAQKRDRIPLGDDCVTAAFAHWIGNCESITLNLLAVTNLATAHHRAHKEDYGESDVEYREQSCQCICNEYVGSGSHLCQFRVKPAYYHFKIPKCRGRSKMSFDGLDVMQLPKVHPDHTV
jgi:hypothetical protein